MIKKQFSLCHPSVMQLAEGYDDLQDFVASLPARFKQKREHSYTTDVTSCAKSCTKTIVMW